MRTTRRQFVAAGACFAAAPAPASVRIVQPHQATPLELLAARELKGALERIFPERQFTATDANRIEGPSLVVGTLGKMPLLDKIGAVRWAAERKVSGPEGYIIKSFRAGRHPVVAVGGSGERGTLYGVYSFLEELGCGFYLSYETYSRSGAELFSDWSIADAPAVSSRAVLNWHNFPSSCSTWNLEDWKTYIDRSARMKFNCLAVHLYGNNPILAYTHNGVRKPIEGLTTSLRGREWGTQNVIDVRRMIGAEGIFREPVFGSRAAMVPDERRAEAAASLMREVFAYARSRGMDAMLAIDLDTESALPLPVIETLPASALIRGRNGHPVPNPDQEAGYAFYRTQVRYVVENYPAVNRIVLWSRATNTPASQVPPAALPSAWSADFEARFSRQGLPSRQREFAAGYFVMNRMARAVRRALDELGRREISMGFGTWAVSSLNTADAMFDPQFAFYSLDGLNLPRDETRRVMRSWTPARPVLSFAYGQNDDGEYAGRCGTPLENLADLLHSSGDGGFGMLHWTWRPMDLVFTSHARQVWRRTLNEPLRQTCEQMAARTFGPTARADAGSYLEDWVRHAPEFGRETLDFFADPDWFTEERCAQAIQASHRRTEDLSRWRPLVAARAGGDWWNYFADWEEYARRFFLSGRNLTLARRAYERGDLAETIRLLNDQPVERMIEQYARTMRALPATPGEKALLLSMNTRWYPYFLMMRQLAGAEPIRFRFARYEPSPLAQQPGRGLFYFDEERKLWYGFLVEERSRTAIVFPRYFELPDGQCGFATASPVDLQIGVPMDYWHFSNPKAARLRGNTPMTNGDYTIQLHFVEPDSLKPGERLFHVELQGRRVLESLDLAAADPGRRGLRKEFPVRVEDGFVRLKLTPLRGEAVLCGFVLLPRQLLK